VATAGAAMSALTPAPVRDRESHLDDALRLPLNDLLDVA
jgi:hypothetical protein